MSGVKGRSGVPRTPEQREAKRRAGLLGAEAARRARGGGDFGGSGTNTSKSDDLEGAIEPEVVPPKGEPLTEEEILSLLPGSNPYDRVVLRSRGRFTYLDGKTREQVHGVELDNQKKAAEVAQARNQTLTIDQVHERDEQVDAMWVTGLRTVHELLRELLPPDKLLAAQNRADAWINKVRTDVADQVEGMK